MDNKKLLKDYIWILFCSVVMTVLSAYVYVKYFSEPIMLLGFCCSFSSAIKSAALMVKTYKIMKG